MQAFADDHSIPPRLRKRMEDWATGPPKSQFQQYGPLNGYLSIKFPPDRFIVKPQTLLRELWDTRGMEEEDILTIQSMLLGVDDHNMEVDQPEAKKLKERLSIDSQGEIVDRNKRYYPDFVVTSYDSSNDDDQDNDVVRLVIEVASLGRNLKPLSAVEKDKVLSQLHGYLQVLGRFGCRWSDKAVGMCIVGTEVSITKSDRNGVFPFVRSWSSIYSPSFTKVINELAAMTP